jgi:predicted site-specific integrase-resolvase
MLQEQKEWYIGIGETAKMLGVHTKTIRRWEKKGYIKEDYRTVGGHKRYNYNRVRRLLNEIIRSGKVVGNLEGMKGGIKELDKVEEKMKTAVLYARVSSSKQKNDLERQVSDNNSF